MLIIILIGSLVLYGIIFAGVFSIIRKIIEERECRTYANLPTEVLMTDVLFDPIFSDAYRRMSAIMSEDKAKELVIDRMLTSKGIIGYRKRGV